MTREPIEIGNVQALPGTRVEGGIPVGQRLDGTPDQIPIIVLHGAGPGPVLWLNGGTHGDEPEGAFSIHLALAALDPAAMRGTLVAVPAMNVPAFQAGERGDPLDTFSYDMNRIYPGREGGYPTERAAWAHWTAMSAACDLQIAIHSGGEHSYLAHMIFAAENAASFTLAAAMGPQWDLVFETGIGGNNPSSKIAAQGGGGITIELGGNCRTLTSDFHEVARDLSESYLNVMRHYRMIDGEATYAAQWRTGHQQPLLAPASGMWVGNPDLVFEQPVEAGTLLGRVYDLYGNIQGVVNAPEDGVVFGLRSRPAVLAGEWCCFFGIIDLVRDDLVG